MVKAILALLVLVPAAPDDTFSIKGTVKFNGPPPPAKANKALMADPACANCHSEAPMKEDLLVTQDGGVKFAFVRITKGLEGKKFDPPKEPVLLDQKGCIYTPHVLGVMAGQTVKVRNSDPFMHNVNGTPFSSKAFNFAQPVQGQVDSVVFPNPEVMVKLACGVHPHMSAWVGVVEHPFFAVTDADGKFEIKGVPPGTYTVTVWHEKLQSASQELVVKESANLDFKLPLKN